MSEHRLLLDMLDESYNRRSWHGATLKGSLRGVDAELAAWRPAPDRRSIHEIVLHAAYWKYAVARRLHGTGRGAFPMRGSNWFAVPSADAGRWREAVTLLDGMHARLRAAVSALTPTALNRRVDGSALTHRFLISGIIAHDLYHAGQIQLLKKLRA